MYTNQQDIKQSHMNVNETNNSDSSQNNEELIEREKIDGTPFWVEGSKEKGYYIRMGKHRLTLEVLRTKEEAIEYINYNMYDMILKMIIGVIRDREEWAMEEINKRTQEELNIHN